MSIRCAVKSIHYFNSTSSVLYGAYRNTVGIPATMIASMAYIFRVNMTYCIYTVYNVGMRAYTHVHVLTVLRVKSVHASVQYVLAMHLYIPYQLNIIPF